MAKAEGSPGKFWQTKKTDFNRSGMVDPRSITGCTWHFRMRVFTFGFTCRDNLAINDAWWIMPVGGWVIRYGIPCLLRPLGKKGAGLLKSFLMFRIIDQVRELVQILAYLKKFFRRTWVGKYLVLLRLGLASGMCLPELSPGRVVII
jgi:hypothetical protein